MNMTAYEKLTNVQDRAEARELAFLAASLRLPPDEALPAAWELLDQAAQFLQEKKKRFASYEGEVIRPHYH